ncbi:MAG: metalloregulator ArsR/SmtB family transcription factor [Planctomycetota bacterium]
MEIAHPELLETRAQLFKALSHPSRLYIVELLAKGPRCVCDITGHVGVDISTVSKHLSVLKNAGVVTDAKNGNMVFYSLRMPCVLSFFRCIDDNASRG